MHAKAVTLPREDHKEEEAKKGTVSRSKEKNGA